jgi:hypothetical protein
MSRGRQVDDAQAIGAEADRAEGNHPVIVRTAVVLKIAHSPDDAQVIFFPAWWLQTDQSGNRTHFMPIDRLSDPLSYRLHRCGASFETMKGLLTQSKMAIQDP